MAKRWNVEEDKKLITEFDNPHFNLSSYSSLSGRSEFALMCRLDIKLRDRVNSEHLDDLINIGKWEKKLNAVKSRNLNKIKDKEKEKENSKSSNIEDRLRVLEWKVNKLINDKDDDNVKFTNVVPIKSSHYAGRMRRSITV